MELDIAKSHEALANASAGINQLCQELKSLVNKVVKSEVRTYRHPVHKTNPELTAHAPIPEPH